MNGIVDYGLWFLAGKLAGIRTSPARLLLGAGVGAVYGLLFSWGNFWLGHWVWKLGSSGLMLLVVAWGNERKKILFSWLYFYGLAGALAGIYGLLLKRFWMSGWGLVLTLLFLGGALLFSPYLQRNKLRQQIRFSLNGREISLDAWLDSGNCLREPFSGFPVVIVEYQAVRDILPAALQSWLENSSKEELEPWTGLRLIPFRSLGQEGGVLPGLQADWLEWGQLRTPQVFIGISEMALDAQGRYQALLNPRTIQG
ncbi:MAG: sigma-E processing peptidase SpoIIGA [Clostridia bacterium]|nr:sigma-E processing peptidase SpoIIGA [Clostridia bacterium]